MHALRISFTLPTRSNGSDSIQLGSSSDPARPGYVDLRSLATFDFRSNFFGRLRASLTLIQTRQVTVSASSDPCAAARPLSDHVAGTSHANVVKSHRRSSPAAPAPLPYTLDAGVCAGGAANRHGHRHRPVDHRHGGG